MESAPLPLLPFPLLEADAGEVVACGVAVGCCARKFSLALSAIRQAARISHGMCRFLFI
jgi:hypothetical protein